MCSTRLKLQLTYPKCIRAFTPERRNTALPINSNKLCASPHSLVLKLLVPFHPLETQLQCRSYRAPSTAGADRAVLPPQLSGPLTMISSVASAATSSTLHSCLCALGSNQLLQLVCQHGISQAQASQHTGQAGLSQLLWQQQQRHKHSISSSGFRSASQLVSIRLEFDLQQQRTA